MDPVTLAGIAVGLLRPFFERMKDRGTERLADETADAAGLAVDRIYDRIKQQVSGDGYGETVLVGNQAEPANEGRRKALETHLTDVLKADPDFAADLKTLVEQARAAGFEPSVVKVTARDSGVTAGGDATISAGRDAAGRDLRQP